MKIYDSQKKFVLGDLPLKNHKIGSQKKSQNSPK